ncbi:uncharacterized protein LOC135178107 isoform X1 [Pogoniulus pusillus]|uniref:uncharacterized protein LOC135178107 isoform X1 n=1 Tax=Pogoniulus pusillus TaxID=488313 RepID=UPI0030B99145
MIWFMNLGFMEKQLSTQEASKESSSTSYARHSAPAISGLELQGEGHGAHDRNTHRAPWRGGLLCPCPPPGCGSYDGSKAGEDRRRGKRVPLPTHPPRPTFRASRLDLLPRTAAAEQHHGPHRLAEPRSAATRDEHLTEVEEGKASRSARRGGLRAAPGWVAQRSGDAGWGRASRPAAAAAVRAAAGGELCEGALRSSGRYN